MLREVSLDHFQTSFQPAIEPAVTNLVFDAVEMQVAVSHDQMIGTESARHNGPDGLT